MVRLFASGSGDLVSIPARVIPKIQKMVLDASLLNNIRKGSREKWSNLGKGTAPSPTPWCVVAIEKGAFGFPSIKVVNFTTTYLL